MSTNGYSASGRSAAGMMSAGTNLRAAGRRREAVDEYDRLAGIAFVLARIGNRALALESLPRDARDRWHAPCAFR